MEEIDNFGALFGKKDLYKLNQITYCVASNLQLFSRWRCRSIHNTYRFSYKYIIRVLNELSDYVYDRAVVR